MGDEDDGTPLSKLAKAIQPLRFRPRIHSAGRLIEHEYGRTPQKGPCQSNALPLPNAQLRSIGEPSSEQLIVAGGKFLDNFIRTCTYGRFRYVLVACVFQIAQCDVLSCRGVVVDRLLKQHCDRTPHILYREEL